MLENFQVSCFAIMTAWFSGPTPPLPQHETLRHFLSGRCNATYSLTLNTSEKCVSHKESHGSHVCTQKQFYKEEAVNTLHMPMLMQSFGEIKECFMFSFLETVPAPNGSASRILKIKNSK